MSEAAEAAQSLLFETFGSSDADPPAVFVVGSPRTGSTLTYQLFVQALEVSYVSNFTAEHYAREPVVGLAIESALGVEPPSQTSSRYGKTDGVHSLSEASAVFAHWFGGGHPSQVLSARVKDGMDAHLRRSFAAIAAMTGRPLLTKNPWNCFRIADLRRLLPQSFFVWIRRDVIAAARSDLRARYKHGGPHVWNSASPANYEEIRKLPYWEQVVEQQYEYNRVLGADLGEYAPRHHQEIWYEDLCARPEETVQALVDALAAAGTPVDRRSADLPVIEVSPGAELDDDGRKIEGYVRENLGRLESFRYSPSG